MSLVDFLVDICWGGKTRVDGEVMVWIDMLTRVFWRRVKPKYSAWEPVAKPR
jgi:hypothetical protein